MLLSRTYHPSEALAPYIRRFYVFEAELPEAMVIEDFLLSETAFVRCLLKGDWKGEVAPGEWSQPGRTLFFGANALPFRVRVQGSFAVTGFAIRPSGWKALFEQSHRDFADDLLPLQDLWGDLADHMQAGVESANDDQGKLAAMEAAIAHRLKQIGSYKTDNNAIFNLGYAYTDSENNRNNNSSTATSSFDIVAAFDRQAVDVARSEYSSSHNITMGLNFREQFFDDYDTSFGFVFVARSGRPYSIVWDNAPSSVLNDSASGDFNSLLYVPTGVSPSCSQITSVSSPLIR